MNHCLIISGGWENIEMFLQHMFGTVWNQFRLSNDTLETPTQILPILYFVSIGETLEKVLFEITKILLKEYDYQQTKIQVV
jgi:hypothetical protein